MENFILGFDATASFLLLVAGGCAAVLLLVLSVLMAVCFAAVVFDWITSSIGRHWARKNHKPRNRLEHILQDGFRLDSDGRG